MKRIALPAVLALALGSAGCAHKQLTNRQVALGAVGIAAIVLLVVVMSTQCDNDFEDCNFQ